ncbi:hypothetical protein LUX34_24040 [Streptomyces werraensis]|nr:hypothetical protein [Streptomyces werraensis]
MSEENTNVEPVQPETVDAPEEPDAPRSSEALDSLLATLDDEVKLALLNEGGKKALLAEREAAKAARRDRDAALAQVQEYERAKLSEQERLTADLEAAKQRVHAVQQRAVRAEVRALAADQFADPDDAHAFLNLDQFVGDDGDIDTDGIRNELSELLKRKPHLAKPSDNSPRPPRPDRSQGSSGNGNRSTSDPGAIFAGLMNQALKGR